MWPRFDVTGTGSHMTEIGSHMTETGIDVIGTSSDVTGTGSDWKWEGHVISGGKPLTSCKNRSQAQMKKREDIS